MKKSNLISLSDHIKVLLPAKSFQTPNPKTCKKVDIHGAFHMKLYILKFKDFIRVVIGSANLFESDWHNWNNILWINDFSKINKTKNINDTKFEDYMTSLIKIVLNDDFNLLRDFLHLDLFQYDFSNQKVCLLASFPGIFAKN